jgi:hypothetical protein
VTAGTVVSRIELAPSFSRKLLAMVAITTVLTFGMAMKAERAEALSYSWRWYGMSIQANRSETNNLAFGSGGAALIASRIPDARIRAIAYATLSAYGLFAGWVFNRGACVAFNITWWGGVYPWYYYGGYCR